MFLSLKSKYMIKGAITQIEKKQGKLPKIHPNLPPIALFKLAHQ